MGITANIYGVSVSFYCKLAIFGRTITQHLRILRENLKKKLKSIKTYIRDHYIQPIQNMRITGMEY
jgi:hypothetical protein